MEEIWSILYSLKSESTIWIYLECQGPICFIKETHFFLD
jgi:hypothetical protein